MTSVSLHAPPRLRALFFLFLNIFFWGVGPLFVKYFSGDFDVWTQNAFRYCCAALVLVSAAIIRRTPIWSLTRAQWGKMLLVALANLMLQTTFASIYYYIYPSVGALILRTDLLFVCILSFVFFKDERGIIRSPFFITGAIIGLMGAILVIWGRDPQLLARLEVTQERFWIGVLLAMACAFSIALYSLTIKRLVRDVDPIISFTHVSWITATILTILMFIFGNPRALITHGTKPLMIMFISAVLCVNIAHIALYAALREIKAVVSTTLMLLTPVVTCVASAIMYGEKDRLTGSQIAGGTLVLLGAWCVGYAQIRILRQLRKKANQS